jgi:uncharacterized lipoprotein YddW (UPF0748 family)
MSKNIILSAPVTHSDWMWNYHERIGQGKKSVRYILDRCKAVGWTKIYWRCFDGGHATYPSQWMDTIPRSYHNDPDNYYAWECTGKAIPDVFGQYKKLDILKEAVSYGHKIGLEIHAWLSINEDDHAWGMASRFCKAHPEYRWVKRSGMPYNSQLSFAFPEVREYKLKLVKEILSYDVDGFFFDWMRTGDVRNGPQTTTDGTADFGYEKPLVEGYKQKYKKDPFAIPNNDETWVQFRCEPQTLFMKEAHRIIKQKDKSLPIAMMGHHPWSYRGDGTVRINGNRNGLLLDVARWAKEGWIDEVVAAGYFTKGGTPEKAHAYMQKEVGEKCKIWLYWWVPVTMKDYEKSLRTAEKLGASQILFWESDYIDHPVRATFSKELLKSIKS